MKSLLLFLITNGLGLSAAASALDDCPQLIEQCVRDRLGTRAAREYNKEFGCLSFIDENKREHCFYLEDECVDDLEEKRVEDLGSDVMCPPFEF